MGIRDGTIKKSSIYTLRLGKAGVKNTGFGKPYKLIIRKFDTIVKDFINMWRLELMPPHKSVTT